jgi:alkylated DNA repair dioxygenase AlkB
MLSLFPTGHEWPEGFSYVPDFISAEEEEKLLQEIKTISLHTLVFQGYEAKRRVASFGWDWSFEKRTLSKGKEIPQAFEWLMERVAQHVQLKAKDFKELLVTEYPTDAVINWHRDAPPFDLIAGISLATDCTFRLRPHDKAKQNRKNIITLPVQRRSLYVMKNAARNEWQHSIAAVKQTRYSITLRTLKALHTDIRLPA